MNIEHLPCGELQFPEPMPMAQIEMKHFDNKIFPGFSGFLETLSKQEQMPRQYNRLQYSAIQCNAISAKEIKRGNRKKGKLNENF